MNDARPVTPWGYPSQGSGSGSDLAAWVNQNMVWLMIGALLVLGWATTSKGNR